MVTLAGEEWLLFKPVPVSVAFLRGTTADEDGNVTMEQEAVFGEMLAMAQATRQAGGIVIVQVKRMASRGTLPAQQVKIPGILVDFVVVDAEQRQTYATDYDPSYSGELRIPVDDIKPLPFGPRKVMVRRAAMELFPGAICNLGAGVSTGLSTIAAEEGLLDAVHLTNEQGLIGGAPITGRDSGGAQNFSAMIDQPAQFDFYDGGGLDLAFLSFAEVDAQGNVNVKPLRRQDHRRRRVHQHRPECQMRRLQRHADSRRPRRYLGTRQHRHSQGRSPQEVRAEAGADLLQRQHGTRARADGAFCHRARGFPESAQKGWS